MDLTEHPVVKWFEQGMRGRNLSPATVRCYRSDLVGFLRFLQGGGEIFPKGIWDLGREDEAWKAILAHTRGEDEFIDTLAHLVVTSRRIELIRFVRSFNRSSTGNRKLVTLRYFYGMMVDAGIIPVSPVASMSLPRGRAPELVFLAPEHFERLMRALGEPTRSNVRDRAFFRILYETGLLPEAALSLTRDAFDSARGVLRLTRGRGTDELILSKEAVQALVRMIEVWGAASQDDPLFTNLRGGVRISARSMRRKLDRLVVRTNLPPGIELRSFRYSYVRRALDTGMSPEAIAKRLGLSSTGGTLVNRVICARPTTSLAAAVA